MPATKPPFRFWSFFFSLNGRVSRLAMWTFVIPWRIAFFAAAFGIQSLRTLLPMTLSPGGAVIYPPWFWLQILLGFTSLVVAWPSFTVRFKRLHDISLTGLPAFLAVLPLAVGLAFTRMLIPVPPSLYAYGMYMSYGATGVVWLLDIILAIVPGKRASNRYGPDPRSPSGSVPDVF